MCTIGSRIQTSHPNPVPLFGFPKILVRGTIHRALRLYPASIQVLFQPLTLIRGNDKTKENVIFGVR